MTIGEHVVRSRIRLHVGQAGIVEVVRQRQRVDPNLAYVLCQDLVFQQVPKQHHTGALRSRWQCQLG
jgi:hypothetical protein